MTSRFLVIIIIHLFATTTTTSTSVIFNVVINITHWTGLRYPSKGVQIISGMLPIGIFCVFIIFIKLDAGNANNYK